MPGLALHSIPKSNNTPSYCSSAGGCRSTGTHHHADQCHTPRARALSPSRSRSLAPVPPSSFPCPLATHATDNHHPPVTPPGACLRSACPEHGKAIPLLSIDHHATVIVSARRISPCAHLSVSLFACPQSTLHPRHPSITIAVTSRCSLTPTLFQLTLWASMTYRRCGAL